MSSGCNVPALPSYFLTTLLEGSGGGDGLRTTTCLTAVVGGKQWLASC